MPRTRRILAITLAVVVSALFWMVVLYHAMRMVG